MYCSFMVIQMSLQQYIWNSELNKCETTKILTFFRYCLFWQIETPQYLAFFTTYICPLQQLLEAPVKILFHISNRYPHKSIGPRLGHQASTIDPLYKRKALILQSSLFMLILFLSKYSVNAKIDQ